MTKNEAYNYDKAMRLKKLFADEKRREFYRQIALQHLDKDIPDRPGELRLDFRPHKCQWSQVAKRCFAKDIVKFMLP